MSNIGIKQNKQKILKLLYKDKKLTKQDIAKKINVSIPTVITNVNELLKEGLIEESGVADSTGGRKPVVVSFLPNSRFAFGVDINPEKVRLILANLDLEIKYNEEFKIAGLNDMEKIMKKVLNAVKNALKTTGVKMEKVVGIGFSLPGTVNEEKLILELAPNIGIKNVDFKEYQKQLNIPIFIENEANAAAIAECNIGIAKEKKDLVYVSITSGVGTGIIFEGDLYKGKNKRAGEFGHMIVQPGGRQCRCGRNGCWEMYSSQKVLIEGHNKISNKKIDNLDQFFNLLKSKDKNTEDYFNNYLDMLAIGMQNIEITLDPDYIVIGGEISEYADLFMDDLKSKIFIENSFYGRDDLKLSPSTLKKDASIMGAALIPIKKMIFQ